jgi:arylsulfatase A-like enzyme
MIHRLAIILLVFATAATAAPRRNVLFIAFDDLGDWIQLLDPESPIRMPNLDRLAQRGVVFRRAFCAAPECNPSRTAVLSGLAPTTSGVYANAADWKRALPDAMMLPRYFATRGYATAAAGKIFHHVDRHFHDERSFEDWLPFEAEKLPQPKHNRLTSARAPDGTIEPLAPTFDWGESPTPEHEMLDARSADYAARFVRLPRDRPFFLAVGFFRPHLPYFAPPAALAAYPAATMKLPPVRADDVADLPAGAHALMRPWARMYRGIVQAPDPKAARREAVAAYAAGATFADAQLGRVLDALDASPHRNNTIIVVWSDHGYHLGEKEHWTKFVLWEKATRVPLLVVAPGVAVPGGVSDRPVSLLDLYPTLVELCDLTPRAGLDGVSLVPWLRVPEAPSSRLVVTTASRGNHAVRSERWRYIRYADGSEELYDHAADPHEWRNIAGDSAHAAVMAAHRRALPREEAAPAANFTRGAAP